MLASAPGSTPPHGSGSIKVTGALTNLFRGFRTCHRNSPLVTVILASPKLAAKTCVASPEIASPEFGTMILKDLGSPVEVSLLTLHK